MPPPLQRGVDLAPAKGKNINNVLESWMARRLDGMGGKPSHPPRASVHGIQHRCRQTGTYFKHFGRLVGNPHEPK
jgi:hypothetical protein